MDKRRHLPKRQVTVSIGTSPRVSFPFPSPSPLLLPIIPLHPAGGFSRRDGPAFNLCDWSMGF